MHKSIKPYVSPVILLIGGWALNMVTPEMPILFGAIIGFASFWIVLAIFSNKPLLKKYPGILEWAPFLDPTGGFSSATQLTGKFIQGQSFHLSMVAYNGKITNRNFDDCDIYGPAIIYLTGTSMVTDCGFDGVPENILIVTKYVPLGAIWMENTVIRDCRFHRISIVGSQEVIDKIKREGFSQPPNSSSSP
jgi:hypothetical protein